MKICLASRFFDFRNGGIGRVSMEIRDRLIARGHDVRTVSINRTGIGSYLSYTALEMPFRLPRKCDVYHALTPMEAMWLPKGKMVVTFHDLFLLTHPERMGSGVGGDGLRNRIAQNYFAFAVNLASAKSRSAQFGSGGMPRMVAVSNQTKHDLKRCFGVPPKSVMVIRNGIRPDLRPSPKPDAKFRIGYLGQLDRRKRVDLLIGSFRASGLDAELVIAGIGTEEPMLRRVAEGDSRIRFLGWVPDEQLCGFYNSLNLFVFPTFIEGYGLPAVEAMACRKPVVVLDDVVMPSEVQSRCITVSNLQAFLSDFDTMGRRMAKLDYESNYFFAKSHDWDKCVDQYEKLYEEIA